MYVFAGIVLLGLVVARLVDLVQGFYELTRTMRLTIAMMLGVGIAWAVDYSLFASWGIAFREYWMEIVGTGFVLAGVAGLWHEILDVLSSYARRVHDQATEIETRLPRAA